mgnify:CR=1 FL=1
MAKGSPHEGTLFVCNVCGEEYVGTKRKWTCPVCGTADSYEEVGARNEEDFGYNDSDDGYYDDDNY